jgi:hypothetical protein
MRPIRRHLSTAIHHKKSRRLIVDPSETPSGTKPSELAASIPAQLRNRYDPGLQFRAGK